MATAPEALFVFLVVGTVSDAASVARSDTKLEGVLQGAPTFLQFIPKVGKYLAFGMSATNTVRAINK